MANKQSTLEVMDMINAKFWHRKKVLITGCTGFKGSWLSMWLSKLGAEVYGYSLKAPTTPSMFELIDVKNNISYYEGDICNFNQFSNYLNKIAPEIVFHLAAQPLVRYSYENPIETYHTNVLGLVNILEAIRQNKKVQVIINVTSDKCYENKEWVWAYRENEAMGGYDPYSNSKGCAELVTNCYQRSYFNIKEFGKFHNTLLASVRAGNVIGGGDWADDRLIPDIIKSFVNKQSVNIRNPMAIRPWQHVLEPLSGYIALAQQLYDGKTEFATGWNFGPYELDIKHVEYIVKKLCELWGDGASWHLHTGSHPHEANYLKLDCSKARTHLGWHPRWNLEQTLEKIVSWYKIYENNGDLYQETVTQINQYMERQSE